MFNNVPLALIMLPVFALTMILMIRLSNRSAKSTKDRQSFPIDDKTWFHPEEAEPTKVKRAA